MRVKNIVMMVAVATLCFSMGVWAGNPTPNNPPGSTAAYTLEDIWQRLTTGAAGAQSTFTEPTAGPGTGTMHTLNEIMAAAPALDDTDGAEPGEVLAGKTYWGLRSTAWATQTGTAAIGNNVNGANGARIFDIPDGFYAGKTATAHDTNLVAGNIKSGVEVFGVTGAVIPGIIAKRVPQTGQTTCWDQGGSPIDCSGTGQDGEYQMGITPVVTPSKSNLYSVPDSWVGERFTDNGDGTVTDNLTALIWLKNANCALFFTDDSAEQNKRSWSNALTAANLLADDFCGLSDGSRAGDWRLPNINELRSLGPTWPYYSPHFTDVRRNAYWSSDTFADNTSGAWYMQSTTGGVYFLGKGSNIQVWPVRGGE